MTLLEQFKDKVLNTEGSFRLEWNGWFYSFMRCTNGNAEYIYREYKFKNKDFSEINLNYKLAAIVDKNTKVIYVIDEYIFNRNFNKEFVYPNGCVNFNDYVVEKNKYFQNVLFRNYYDSIEVDINSVTDEDFINSQKRAARISILSGNEMVLPKFNNDFTSNDIAKMICGYMNIEDEANERFEYNKGWLIKTKLGNELAKKYITDEDFINSQKRAARISILSGDDVTLPKFNHMFTSNDIAKMICGYMNIEDEANERFANTREFMIKTKLRQELIKKYIEEKSVVEDWKIELARSINNLKANYVNVEFNFNGNIGTEKIDPKKIIRILIDNYYFSDYNFATSKSGDKLLKTLGVSNTYNKRETWLTCKHITKITYGRKTLYERKQNG